jgi:hypothetical protein
VFRRNTADGPEVIHISEKSLALIGNASGRTVLGARTKVDPSRQTVQVDPKRASGKRRKSSWSAEPLDWNGEPGATPGGLPRLRARDTEQVQ